MDDGFQHLPLKKHLNLVLDDPAPKNRLCLPAGPYREPRWNRRRADTVLPGRFRVESEPLRLTDPDGQPESTPQEYALLCALGQPERFVAAVSRLVGAGPEPALLLGDHDPLDAGTLLQRLPTDWPTIVTAKDWVKLRERPDIGTRQFLIARHSVRVEPAAEFREWLGAKLDERKEQAVSQ
jgi:tetraacyldisaccharide 4'-kinase